MSNSQKHGNGAFVFTEIITPKQNRADDVLSLAIKSADQIKQQSGLIQAMVTRSEKQGQEICTITTWESKSDFQNFMKSEAATELLKSEDMKNVKAWMSDYKMLMSDLVHGWHGSFGVA